MKVSSVKSRAFSDGAARGYVYGCAVGCPLLVVAMLVLAARGQVQTGLVCAALGVIGTYLSWSLVPTVRNMGGRH